MYNRKVICKKSNVGYSNPKKGDAEEEIYENELVTCEDNHIYFYDEVNTKSILTMNKFIKALNIRLLLLKADMEIKYDSHIDLQIYLHINSCGGYITDALSGVDAIRNSKIPVTTIIEGVAASSATLLSIVGAKRQITQNSSMLIHQLSGHYDGTHQQMKDDLQNSTYLEEICNKIYLENSYNKLKKKVLAESLKHDLWWNSSKCMEYGLVDEIV